MVYGPRLPARLHDAGQSAQRRQLTQRNARQLELPVHGPRTARELAPVAYPRRRRVARQVRQLEAGPRQVKGADVALAENGGGVIGMEEAVASVVILKKE